MTPRAVVLDAVVRVLYPFMLVVSLWIVLRGHNAPGGGFIGGLVAVSATAVLAVGQGSRQALARMPLGPIRLGAASLLLAALSGLPAVFDDRPYMTQLWANVSIGFTELPLSTVLLFDLGVYGTVWSALGGLAASIIGIDEEEP